MIIIPKKLLETYPDIFTEEVQSALAMLSPLDKEQKDLMAKRNERRKNRHTGRSSLTFLGEEEIIPGTEIRVREARAGEFTAREIPSCLSRQWIQGTGPATKPSTKLRERLRNVAYALLSGADGWMFDGEDALGQVKTMSLENIENLRYAIRGDKIFMEVAEEVSIGMNKWSEDFLGRKIVEDVKKQLDFTTILYRARGLHLDDRHIINQETPGFSASITDVCLFVGSVHKQLISRQGVIVLYLPKIQTAEEAAFWNKILTAVEAQFHLREGSIRCYVLIEQVEATYQLMEIRAALGVHFVGYNTGRWDYINSLSDVLAGEETFVNPNIEAIGMTYAYMGAYEDRVRRAANTADRQGQYALWQGGMEPNIPVGSAEGVATSMEKALAGARREEMAGASGKWVAHWKMVHIIRPVWEEKNQPNQLGRSFEPLDYTETAAKALTHLEDAPRSIRGARNLLSVAIQYGNAFLQGQQAAALKPADFFGDPNVLYLMEDAATGEIRVSVLWEWLHKKASLNEDDQETGVRAGDVFTLELFERLLREEFDKLLAASDKDVYDSSKQTTLPIAKEIVVACIKHSSKAPWYIDLLNANLNNEDFNVAQTRIQKYFETLLNKNERLTFNFDQVLSPKTPS